VDLGSYLNTILLTIITTVVTTTALYMRKIFAKHLNRMDVNEWITSSINYGCEEILGEEFKKYRDEKFSQIEKRDQLKNKHR